MRNLVFLKMVVGEGFEPSKAEPAELQSAPFDRFGTPLSSKENAESTRFFLFVHSDFSFFSILQFYRSNLRR